MLIKKVDKKVVEKFGKGGIFALSLHPLKRNGGARRGDGEFAWRRRSGVVDDDLSRRVTFKRGLEKKVRKNFAKDLEGNVKTPYLCNRFRF